MTLFEMKENLSTLQAAINADAEWIASKAADPATEMEKINEKKAHRDELQSRYDMLKAEHDAQEARQKAAVQTKAAMGEKEQKIASKAAFYRDAMNGQTKKAYEGLGAIPAANADLGSGDKLLPTKSLQRAPDRAL